MGYVRRLSKIIQLLSKVAMAKKTHLIWNILFVAAFTDSATTAPDRVDENCCDGNVSAGTKMAECCNIANKRDDEYRQGREIVIDHC